MVYFANKGTLQEIVESFFKYPKDFFQGDVFAREKKAEDLILDELDKTLYMLDSLEKHLILFHLGYWRSLPTNREILAVFSPPSSFSSMAGWSELMQFDSSFDFLKFIDVKFTSIAPYISTFV